MAYWYAVAHWTVRYVTWFAFRNLSSWDLSHCLPDFMIKYTNLQSCTIPVYRVKGSTYSGFVPSDKSHRARSYFGLPSPSSWLIRYLGVLLNGHYLFNSIEHTCRRLAFPDQRVRYPSWHSVSPALGKKQLLRRQSILTGIWSCHLSFEQLPSFYCKLFGHSWQKNEFSTWITRFLYGVVHHESPELMLPRSSQAQVKAAWTKIGFQILLRMPLYISF